MDDLQRFLTWCADGRVVRPETIQPNLVDLSRAIASASGALDTKALSPGGRSIAEDIGAPDHLVFILIDGMGKAILDLLEPGSFLRTHCVTTLTSVFPSTTAAALTTLATGAWPGAHGVLGWWIYFRDKGVSATVLPFVERYTEAPLNEFGITPEAAFPIASLTPAFRRAPLALLPERIAASTYSRYYSGGTPTLAYTTIADGFHLASTRVIESTVPTYTWLYLPQLDALAHERGPDDPDVVRLLGSLDAECALLREQLPGNGRVVIAADHGLARLPSAREFILAHDDPLLSLLECPPTGEPRTPLFHVLPGKTRQFVNRFRAQYGDTFVLLSFEQAEGLHLFGPQPSSATARARAGNFLAIAPEAAVLYHVPRDGKRMSLRGVHAGLTPSEMHVPLVIA